MHDHVVLEVLEGEERETAGGILLSQGMAKTHKRARVVRVGPGRDVWRAPDGKAYTDHGPDVEHVPREYLDKRTAMPVTVGDLVFFEDWRTRWHNGSAEWPVAGDHALVPVDALALSCDEGDLSRNVDFVRLGKR